MADTGGMGGIGSFGGSYALTLGAGSFGMFGVPDNMGAMDKARGLGYPCIGGDIRIIGDLSVPEPLNIDVDDKKKPRKNKKGCAKKRPEAILKETSDKAFDETAAKSRKRKSP